MNKFYFTYIITNKNNTVLYVGVTDNLERRAFEHKNKLIKGFTSKYNINKIIWYDVFNSPQEAIEAEKKIKGWTRIKKVDLIQSMNPKFQDLTGDRDSSVADSLRMTEKRVNEANF